MIREGMALNSKQRGEAEEERTAVTGGPSNADIKPAEEDKEAMQRNLQTNKIPLKQEEYLRAYYAAIVASQQNASQAAAANNEPSTAGQHPSTEPATQAGTGVTIKEDGEENEDDVEWEDAPATDLLGADTMHENLEQTGAMPLEDQGDGAGEGEDDDIDWEEG